MRCRLHVHHCLQQFFNHLGCLLFTKLLDLVQRLLYLPGGLFFDLRMGARVLYRIGENTISIYPYMLPSTNEPPSCCGATVVQPYLRLKALELLLLLALIFFDLLLCLGTCVLHFLGAVWQCISLLDFSSLELR